MSFNLAEDSTIEYPILNDQHTSCSRPTFLDIYRTGLVAGNDFTITAIVVLQILFQDQSQVQYRGCQSPNPGFIAQTGVSTRGHMDSSPNVEHFEKNFSEIVLGKCD